MKLFKLAFILIILSSCKGKVGNTNSTDTMKEVDSVDFYNSKGVNLLELAFTDFYSKSKDSLFLLAIENFNLSIIRDSSFYHAYNNLATTFYYLEDFDKQEKVLTKVVQIHPNPESFLMLGVLYEQRGDSLQSSKNYLQSYSIYKSEAYKNKMTAKDLVNLEYLNQILNKLDE